MDELELSAALPLRAANAGLFISRGVGIHPTRVIDSHELIFVQAGRLGLYEGDTVFDLEAGQTLHLWPGRTHGGSATYPLDLRFYWIHFSLAPAPPAAAPGGEPAALRIPQVAALERPERMTELFRRFLDDQESGRLRPLSAGLIVMQMLAEVALARHAGAGAAAGAGAVLAHRAATLIRTRYAEPLATAPLARLLGCNEDYLGRVFRAVHGMTVTEAIHQRRLIEARKLLLDAALSIPAVAQACGFPDAGYFRRLFIRHAGLSPSAYRRLYTRVHVTTV